jgi:hypothetical protein
MEPSDIGQCIGLLTNHPGIRSRFGDLIEVLPEAWLSLLESNFGLATVFFADETAGAPICIAGITAVVRDDFLIEMKTPPHFWIGPEIARRIIDGRSPVLTAREFRDGNSRGGLNLVCLENCVHPGYLAAGELLRYVMSVFLQIHRGYLWKEVIANQPESLDRLGMLMNTGALIWDPVTSSYSQTLREDPGAVVRTPHIFGNTRELEQKRQRDWAGSWVGALFDYHAPILGFNRSEQRQLSCALSGATDEDLAATLGTSLSTIKKTWVSIYGRAGEHLPLVASTLEWLEVTSAGRGRERRRHLLFYLREHPEELCPYSRKLLSQAAEVRALGSPSNSLWRRTSGG